MTTRDVMPLIDALALAAQEEGEKTRVEPRIRRRARVRWGDVEAMMKAG